MPGLGRAIGRISQYRAPTGRLALSATAKRAKPILASPRTVTRPFHALRMIQSKTAAPLPTGRVMQKPSERPNDHDGLNAIALFTAVSAAIVSRELSPLEPRFAVVPERRRAVRERPRPNERDSAFTIAGIQRYKG